MNQFTYLVQTTTITYKLEILNILSISVNRVAPKLRKNFNLV